MIRRLGLILALMTSGLLAGPAEARRGDEVVALHPLRGLGVDDETVENLQRIVHNELHGVPGMRLVRAERTRRHVAAESVACDGADPCLAEFARNLGAAVAVYGVVGGLGDSYTIAFKAVNAEDGEVRTRVELRVGGAREVLIDGIRAGAYQLLRPDLFVGSLQLDLPVEGAEVYVDGRLVGTTPLEGPIADLEPGQRALKIVKTGFSDFDKFIEVRFRRTTVVTIDLEMSTVAGVIYEEEPEPEAHADTDEDFDLAAIPVGDADAVAEGDAGDDAVDEAAEPVTPDPVAVRSGPSFRRMAAYGLLAGGAAGLAVGGGFGLSAQRQAQALTASFGENGGPGPEHVEDWNAAHATARNANTFYAIGGVVTAVGAALLVADLASPAPLAAAGSGAAEGRLVVLPGGPGGLGLTLVWAR
jgi:hypothetical protein